MVGRLIPVIILKEGSSRAGRELTLGLVERPFLFYGIPGGEVEVILDSRHGRVFVLPVLKYLHKEAGRKIRWVLIYQGDLR